MQMTLKAAGRSGGRVHALELPVNQTVRKLSAALAAGCSIIEGAGTAAGGACRAPWRLRRCRRDRRGSSLWSLARRGRSPSVKMRRPVTPRRAGFVVLISLRR